MAEQVASPLATDPAQDAVLGLVRQALLAVGVLLTGNGFIGPNGHISANNWQFFVGLILTAIPVVWSAWSKYRAASSAKDRETIAVMAGINLVTKGAAIATDFKTIPATAAPLPVTPARAQAIIANFAPQDPHL